MGAHEEEPNVRTSFPIPWMDGLTDRNSTFLCDRRGPLEAVRRARPSMELSRQAKQVIDL